MNIMDTGFSGASGSSVMTATVDAGTEQIVLPADFPMATADYGREGSDLVLTGSDGAQVTLVDYFAHGAPATLTTPDGAEIAGSVAAKLAGPLAPGQVAQAVEVAATTGQEPIGQVDTVDGTVTVTHADGTKETLAKGDSVFQGDILETSADGAVGIVLADNSVFSLSDSGRMVLDEMVYDPGSQEGSASFALLTGAATFVSGQIAKFGQDAMVVKTPVATIGIRGTKVFLETDGQSIQAVNLPETTLKGETVGEIVLMSPSGAMLGTINSFGGGWQWTPSASATPSLLQMDAAQVSNIVSQVTNYLPKTLEEKAVGVMDRLNEIRAEAEAAQAAGDEERAADLEAQAEEAEAQLEQAVKEVEENLGYKVNLINEEDTLGLEDSLDNFDTAAGGDDIIGGSGLGNLGGRSGLDIIRGQEIAGGGPSLVITTEEDNQVINHVVTEASATDLQGQGNGLEGNDGNDVEGGGQTDGDNDTTEDGTDDDGGATVTVFSGQVVDGYLAGARVFVDVDGDGTWDSGEDYTFTDDSGNFNLSTTQTGVLTTSGGTDIETGLDFTGTLTAPSGSTVITPLTTLIQNQVAAGADAATAEANVAASLGLEGYDLLNADPQALAEAGDVELMRQSVMVANMVTQVAGALQGQGVSTAEAMAQAFEALTGLTDGGTLDLTDAANMETLVSDAAAGAGVQVDAQAIGGVLANANQAIENIDLSGGAAAFMDSLAATSSYIQGELAQAIQDVSSGASQVDLSALSNPTAMADAAGRTGTGGDDVLNGTSGDDVMSGKAGDDEIYGNDGNDTLNGGADNDHLFGGAGNDTLTGGTGENDIDGGDGDDTAVFSGQLSDYTITATEDGLSVVRNDGTSSDLLTNVENFTFEGDEATYTLDQLISDDLIGSSGDDVIYGTVDDDVIMGMGGSDTLYGSEGDDTIYGDGFSEDGNPTLLEAGGNNSLGTAQNIDGAFGLFSDELVDGSDTLAHASIYGTGDGNTRDWYSFTVADGGVTMNFDIDFGRDDLNTLGENDDFDPYIYLYDANGNLLASDDDADYDPGTYDSYDSNLTYTFSSGGTYYIEIEDYYDDPIPANSDYLMQVTTTGAVAGALLDSALDGNNSGNDTLDGGAGSDTLYGGAGDDDLFGGDGGYSEEWSEENVWGEDSETDYGQEFNNFTESWNENTLYGGSGNDTLTGGTGDNSLFGGDGDDAIFGGTDMNTYTEYNTGDVDQERFSHQEGSDDGYTYVYESNWLNWDYAYSFANQIIDGGAGNDVVTGGAGEVVIFGGDGADTLTGASESNQYSELNEWWDYSAGIYDNNAYQGYENLSYHLDDWTATYPVDLYGTSYDSGDFSGFGSVIYGDSVYSSGEGGYDYGYYNGEGEGGYGYYIGEGEGGDNDVIFGGVGDNLVYGEGGDDQITMGTEANTGSWSEIDLDVDAEGDGESGAWISMSLSFAGELTQEFTGEFIAPNEVGWAYQEAWGGDGNDVITGGIGDNRLYGDWGDDVISGSLGFNWNIESGAELRADVYVDGYQMAGPPSGFEGTYEEYSGLLLGDIFSFVGESGSATLYSMEEYFAYNQLDGGYGDDTLYGGVGDNEIYGGDGNDQLFGSTALNTIEAHQMVTDIYGDYTSDYTIEHAYSALDGGYGDDTLTGGVGDNILYGGDGDDILTGGSEGYNYANLSDSDWWWYEGGEASVETSWAYNYMDGGSGDDTLTGGDGFNLLMGGDGADTLIAGNSNDSSLDGDFDYLMYQAYNLGEDFGGNNGYNGEGEGFDGLDIGNDNMGGPDYTSFSENFFDNYTQFVSGSGDFASGEGVYDNVLYGGAGADTMTGGSGDDLFRYVLDDLDFEGGSHDTIFDFDAFNDMLQFGASFSFLSYSSSSSSGFGSGAMFYNAGASVTNVGSAFNQATGYGDFSGQVFLFFSTDESGDQGQLYYGDSNSYSQVATINFADGSSASDFSGSNMEVDGSTLGRDVV
ncbi:hypothetical protein JCM17960_08140 [Magnetospira thiophila]